MIRTLATLFIIALFSPHSYAYRTLEWKQIKITADLTEQGAIKITENQTYHFNGKWNGGERTFDIRIGQEFNFESIERYYPNRKKWIRLKEGSLDNVDYYKFVEENKLRWRSRKSNAAPFNNTKIKYRLKYSISGVLRKREENKFHLRHDFLFKDRDWIIRNYELNFSIDPAWKANATIPIIAKRKNVRSLDSHVVDLQLTHNGGLSPNVNTTMSEVERMGYFLFLWPLVIIVFTLVFFIRDRHHGRFVRVPGIDIVDDKYLEENLFSHPPEQIGALWDEQVSSAEVTAILARLIQEEKLEWKMVDDESSWKWLPFIPKKKMIRFFLKAPRNSFKGYERNLIHGLFPKGITLTDQPTIRKHYSSSTSGFDPVNKINAGIMSKLKKGKKMKPTEMSKWFLYPMLIFYGAWFITGISTFISFDFATFIPLLVSSIIIFVLAGIIGIYCHRSLSTKMGHPFLITIMAIITASFPFFCFYILDQVFIFGEDLILLSFLSIMSLASASSIWTFWLCASNNLQGRHKKRRALTAIRNYFIEELQNEKPNLKDEWFPYLIAFGLAHEMDRWVKDFAVSAIATSSYTERAFASSGGSFSGGLRGWSGGGGGFSGAGATATWASAASSFSASAAAASSSSSSSGGGGSFSGGGGGGGW